MRVFVDIETRATVDLRTTSVYRYTEDPEFAILLAGWMLPGDEKVRIDYSHAAAVARFRELWDAGTTFVAHNAAFERVCFSAAVGLPVGHYLPADRFHDTQAVAAERGLPQKLEKLAPALGAEPKDPAGTRLINLFCKPNRKGGWNGPETHPIEWLDFVAYLEQDVVTLRDVDTRMGAEWPGREHAVYLADQAINDRGVLLDLELARAAMSAAEDNRVAQEDEVRALTGVANPGSQKQMMEWCGSVGLRNEDLQKGTVEDLLAGELHDDVRRVLELRQELALVASKKFGSALDSVSSDGRLRGSYRFHGAHTGRWTAHGVQPHNLPREQLADEDATDAAILDLALGAGATAHTLKALVRAMFLGPYTVVDYSAIEARVIAWLAGEGWALEAFRAGRDIYVETAERMGGLTRSQGKVAVLALGYAGGVGSLRAMAGAGFYYHPTTGQIIDAGSLGASHEGRDNAAAQRLKVLTDDQIKTKLVDPWRKANSNIVSLWGKLGDAFGRGGAVGEHLRVELAGSDRRLVLPSGRVITYRDCRWERYRVQDPKTGRWINKEGWRFVDPNKGARIGTYGGKLAENATQAVARDIMAEALVRLHAAGYAVVGHVHDEIIVEGHHADDVAALMTAPPSWAAGLPIDAEGGYCRRYRKV